MTTTVPLSALATAVEDIDAPLTRKFLFPDDDIRLHRHMEYLWGLEIYTIDPTHERSILHIRKSMETPFPSGAGSWTLVPTEETLAAMDSLQVHNFTSPVSERKSFLTEFAADEYEYIFVPLYTDVDFFLLQPGQAPRRFAAPYTNFPRVTSSANPFFVTFYSRLKIQPFHASTSQGWHHLYRNLRVQWRASPLPEEFLTSCYPETLISESDHGSQPEAQPDSQESKSGSDETVATPADEEGPSPVLDKDIFVHHWVREDASQPHERVVLGILPPDNRSRKLKEYARLDPRWRKETKRGKELSERLSKRPRCA
ncbi:hypothetical protein B0H19DRAFT_1101418 [Mycena capillaripes]|nr:hypothetical protein B0H19DRAFT_1101418 [Mycena capillaripes]